MSLSTRLSRSTSMMSRGSSFGDKAGAQLAREATSAAHGITALTAECIFLIRDLSLRLMDMEAKEPSVTASVNANANASVNASIERDVDELLASEVRLEALNLAYKTVTGYEYQRGERQKRERKAEKQGEASDKQDAKKNKALIECLPDSRTIRKGEVVLIDRREVVYLPLKHGAKASGVEETKGDETEEDDDEEERTQRVVFYRLASGEGLARCERASRRDVRGIPDRDRGRRGGRRGPPDGWSVDRTRRRSRRR